MSSPSASEAPRGAASRRWLGVLAVGVVVATGCILAGRWQWSRHEHRAAAAAVVEANYDAAPVPLGDVLAGPAEPLSATDEWRPVTVSGRYAAGGTVVLRNRPVDGAPAVHVLSPLVVPTAAGPAVLVVDRGWVAAGAESVADGVPAPPGGDVEVVVRLRRPEPAGREGPPGQTYRINPEGVLAAGSAGADAVSLPAFDAYGVLARETPSAASSPAALPPPDTGLGPHLSYAFQWWVFALGALVGAGVLVHRERTAPQVTGAATAPVPGPPVGAPAARTGPGGRLSERARTTPRRRRRPSAEDDEDALIDAQLEAHREPRQT